MLQEILARINVFHFLLQTGYTFENALRVVKRPLNSLPETVQANFEMLLKLMGERADPSSSAVKNIRVGEAAYRKAKNSEAKERRKRHMLNPAPEEEESKNPEASRSRPSPELPRYTE